MTYIIAELGSVPDGSPGQAVALIGACVAAGADAVKLQDHRGEKVKGNPPWFSGHEPRADYLKRTSFSQDDWKWIHSHCHEYEVDLIVSPFSVEAVALLEQLPVDAYKIASGQVTNIPMLEAIGKTDRRVYLSTGMTTDEETGHARAVISQARPGKSAAHIALLNQGTDVDTVLMACTSEYPVAAERVGLNRFNHHETEYAGFSDHTLGFAASLAAITLGATVIERHVCFDRRGYGTDCAHSLTLDEFARFVREVRDLDVMLANPVDKDALCATPAMQTMRAAFLEVPGV